MRAVLIGAGSLSRMTAHVLIRRHADVVIIEEDREAIEAIEDELDCAFIHGDGTRPQILKEAKPSEDSVLFCLSDNDQANILASLVGRSLGFGRVFTKIEDSDFEHICMELSLEDTIVPDRYVAQILSGIAEGKRPLDFASFFKQGIRLFSFVADKSDQASLDELDLPQDAEVVCIYRDNDALVGERKQQVKAGDEVVIISHEDVIETLKERWGEESSSGEPESDGSFRPTANKS